MNKRIYLFDFTKNLRRILVLLIFLFASLQMIAQPANDNCTGATVLTPGTSCNYISSTTVGATASAGIPNPSCGNYAGGDVWFQVVVPASGHLTFDTQGANSSYDASMAIYSGPCTSLTEIECDADDSNNGAMPMINNSSLTPGSTVYVRVWTANGAAGEAFNICAVTGPVCLNSTPAGDYCSTATPICNFNGYCGNTSATYGYTVSPTDNTDENGSPLGAIFCGSIENNSWMSFVADATTAVLNVAVSNCTMNYGIQMEIYSTTDCYNYTAVSNCYNPGTPINGTISATGLTIGQTYYLMIDGNAGDVCDYVISANSGVFTVSAGPDVTICPGQSTTLNGSGGTTFSWSPPTGLSNPNIANPVANPTVTTTYTLTVTGGSAQCSGTDAVTVTVAAPTSTASNNGPLCSGQTLNLSCTPSGGTAYNWVGPNGFSSNVQNPVITNAQPAASGVYTVTVTSGACTSTATTTVSVSATPTVVASSNSPICPGTTLNLTSTAGGTTYNWTGPNGFSSALQNPSITNATPAASGIYTVTITLTGGCSGTDTVSVIVNANMVITATATPPAICPGGSSSLSATCSAPGAVFGWMPGSLSGTPVVVNPAVTTVYTVGGSASGCTGTASVTVTVNPNPTISFSTMPSLCATSPPLTLNQASPAGGTYSGTGVAGNMFNPATSGLGTFDIIYSYTNPTTGCSNTDTTQISVTNGLTISVTPATSSICPGTSVVLTASGAGSFVWAPTTGLSNSTGATVTANPTSSTVYTVTGSNPDGCMGTNSATVNFYSSSQVSIVAMPNSGCSPLNVAFDYSPPANVLDSTWHWDFDDTYSTNNTSTDSSVQHLYTHHGNYTVTFTAQDVNGCTVTATTPVAVYLTPIADFYYSPDYAYTDYPLIFFKDQSTGALLWNWSFGDPVIPSLNVSTLQNPSHSYSDSGLFHVQLIVDNNGCKDTANKDVYIYLNALVFVPNAFTPNEDGKNDIFIPAISGVDESDYSFVIYDRWGKEMFSTHDVAQGWNGKNNGKDVAQGVFTYVIDYTEIKGVGHKIKGLVTLYR
ncbi:MAG: PKD domain-containing protein [Bacteroidota bacterium]